MQVIVIGKLLVDVIRITIFRHVFNNFIVNVSGKLQS